MYLGGPVSRSVHIRLVNAHIYTAPTRYPSINSRFDRLLCGFSSSTSGSEHPIEIKFVVAAYANLARTRERARGKSARSSTGLASKWRRTSCRSYSKRWTGRTNRASRRRQGGLECFLQRPSPHPRLPMEIRAWTTRKRADPTTRRPRPRRLCLIMHTSAVELYLASELERRRTTPRMGGWMPLSSSLLTNSRRS